MANENFEKKKQLKERLETDYTYHAPTPATIEKYTLLRTAGQSLASLVVDLVPEGREQSLALTKIEEAIMQANAGIARWSK